MTNQMPTPVRAPMTSGASTKKRLSFSRNPSRSSVRCLACRSLHDDQEEPTPNCEVRDKHMKHSNPSHENAVPNGQIPKRILHQILPRQASICPARERNRKQKFLITYFLWAEAVRPAGLPYLEDVVPGGRRPPLVRLRAHTIGEVEVLSKST